MIAALIAVVGGLIFGLSKLNVSPNVETVKDKVESALPGGSPTITQPREVPGEPPLGKSDIQEMIASAIAPLQKQIDDLAKVKSTTPVVSQSQTSSSQTTSTSTTPKTLYIPIGYGGSGTSTSDFATVTGHEVSINPSDYPGYKQMVFEASFRIFQGNGKGEVRLFNKTDGTAVLNSVLSTTSQDYSTKTSSGFTLTSGAKTYTVQAKSSTGYSVDLQLTRVRVDY